MAFGLPIPLHKNTHNTMKTLKLKLATYTLALATVSILGAGCNSFTKTQKGAAIGAGAGGTIGAFIGKKGEAITLLDPDGTVKVNGEIWNASSLSGKINPGENIIVRDLKKLTLYIERV